MSGRRVDLLIEDIWEAIERVERYIQDSTGDTFKKDDKTADAVVRNLEIIGEAASRLPDDFKTNHSEIEWGKIVAIFWGLSEAGLTLSFSARSRPSDPVKRFFFL